MRFLLLTLLTMQSLFVFAQKMEIKKKLKVAINYYADSSFQVRFIDPNKDTVVKMENVTYDAQGRLLSFQRSKKLDWSKSIVFHRDSARLPVSLDTVDVLYADIKPGEGRLLVYFWPYMSKGKVVDNETNKFLKNHEFSITLEDRTNLSFSSSSWHFGVLTLPLKVYIGAPDSVSAVQTAASAGLYVGKKWGRTKFVKLPSEKEFSTYQSAISLNGFLGVNALELKEENTSDKAESYKGNVTTLSLGIAAGWHYKTFTVFLAAGFDKALSKKADNWLLKKSPWIGFGAGFEIF